MKFLYYESFCADIQENHEFARNYAILTGSFSNMEMAQKIISTDNPDYKSTEQDFAESTKMVMEGRDRTLENKRAPRRRRVING